MGERVDVDAVLGVRQRVAARRARDDARLREPRRAAAAFANLPENSPNDRCCDLRADQPEGGDVPEGRGAAVAEHHLVAVGQGEKLAQAGGDPAYERLDRGLPM